MATPQFSYETGKYHHPISVEISCATPDAKIYYTTDGTTPDENSTPYTGTPVLVYEHVVGDSVTFTGDNDPDVLDENAPLRYRSMILKAIAVGENNAKSDIASAEYVIDLVDASLNIPYADPPVAGGTKHELDVYHPIGEENTPVLLFIHGGAWKMGDKNLYMELGNTMAGYYRFTTVVANYELSCDPWNAVFPEHILDVASAFSWVYEHISEYGGDPENIYLFGQSAGGHLVSLLATDSNYLIAHELTNAKIKGVISMSGAYELYDLVAWPSNPDGLNAQEVLEYKGLCAIVFGNWEQGTLDSFSPQEFIKVNQPPFRIIALNETDTFPDMPGFSQQANNFYSAILALNNPSVEMKILNENEIPEKVRQMDFPEDTKGHYQEIYAINTRDWDSRSSKLVAEFLQTVPEAPTLQAPGDRENNVAPYATLQWEVAKKAIYYHLQISENENFPVDSLFFDSPIADTSWKILLSPQKNYYWRVSAVNGLGEGSWSETRQFSTSELTGVKNPETLPPQTPALMNLYPNPFNGVLHLQIEVAGINRKQIGQIKIFDVLGRNVYSQKVTVNSGYNDFLWQPATLSSGMYFVNFSFGENRLMRKVMYVK
ncbi:MAG: carboxylesterase family protein [Calditrichaeota bacterium]|nr:carboxylesterase family protein [Calditrichota bacterium]